MSDDDWRERMHDNFMGLDFMRQKEANQQRTELSTGEFPLPTHALERVPQDVLADIFHAQRKLLAELERLAREPHPPNQRSITPSNDPLRRHDMETKDYYGSPDPWDNIKARVLRLRRERRCEARSRGVSAVDRQCDLRAGHDGPHAAYASHWDRFEWVHNETTGA